MRWMLVAAAVLTACGPDGARGDGEVIALVAASLEQPVEDLAEQFEHDAAHDDRTIEVVVSVAGSAELATQVINGAPVDVFASADRASLDRAMASTDAAGEPVMIAVNRPAIVAAASNPLAISTIDDLASTTVRTVVCAPEVPCGAYAEDVLAEAGVHLAPVSLERSVNGVVTKVALGEADAGIAYATDGYGRDDIAIIDIDTEVVAPAPAVAFTDAGGEFVDFLTSDAARATFAAYGFTPP